MNTDHGGNTATPIFAARPGAALGMPKVSPDNDLRAQFTARLRVNGVLDGFVRNLQGQSIRMHKRQYVCLQDAPASIWPCGSGYLPLQRCAPHRPTFSAQFRRTGSAPRCAASK